MEESKAKDNKLKPNHPAVKYVEIGADTPRLFKGETFYWINSTDCDRAVAMCAPNPLTNSIYVVPAHSRSEATVLHCPPPPEEAGDPSSVEDAYKYEATGGCGCQAIDHQPQIKIGR